MTTFTPRLPLPYGMDVETWASQLQAAFPHDWIPRLVDPSDWRRWAESFMASPTFQQFRATDPFQSKTWSEWAATLVLVMPFAP